MMKKSFSVSLFYLKTDVGKLMANIVSGVVRNKEKRHRLRNRLDPLNPDRCVRYLSAHYALAPATGRLMPSPATGRATQTAAAGEHQGTLGFEPIWMCWLQGLEQAPQLVVNCVESVRRHACEGQQVIVLTAQNYGQYAALPQVMVDKWQRGIITNTHFSDLIRIYALARYGGYWIDATCLQTGDVPAWVAEEKLFLLHSHGEFSYTLIQSCFIRCLPGDYVLRRWCEAMEVYWQREHRLIHYFTLHLMFIALLRSDAAFREEYGKMPVVSDEPMHRLLRSIVEGKPYRQELMEEAAEGAFFQKLTYKFPKELLDNPDSFASVLSRA